ncbi:MAG: hypothetical protein CVU38_21065 [Chloroflexi bacterium HGW-Chloroflexi-1]|nr:MAG: hypothetical protein CVU38_21065 [Chloroflexi bacterium HGW-Chloroflexi-1]
MHWRQNPQRVAWFILIASFVACCVLTVAVPLGARSFVLHATRSRAAYATALTGTAQLQLPRAADPTAITERRPVAEGSKLITDNTARALLAVYTDETGEQVLATFQLFQDTAVTLEHARTPRFDWSKDPDQISLDLERGRLLISTQTTGVRAIRVWLTTPQATIIFSAGAYDIIIQGEETQVRARSGAAQVLAAGTQMTVNSGERVSAQAGRAPSLPVPGAENLVRNGSFEGELAPAWQETVTVSAGLAPGEITRETDGQRRVVRFSRRTEDAAPNTAGIQQNLNRDVQGYDSLVLRLDLKLLYQSVPGGGYLASEYPVMIDIFYTDIYGKDLHWYQGFYYMNLPPALPWLPPTGEQIPRGIWYTYESQNLFDRLRDTRPARINSITIYASGHDYDSMISDVALSAR